MTASGPVVGPAPDLLAPDPLATGPIDRDEALTRAEQARERAPLASHADVPGGAEGPDDRDAVALLEAQATTRIPELVPIRYGRMLANPFTFYRGAAGLMAADLGSTPSSGLLVQLCGDAHVSNFGMFGSAERRHLFDLNDFDETWPGPFEWDVKRLAASLEIAGRHRGWKRARRERLVTAMVRSYRMSMAAFAALPMLDVWYSRMEIQPGLPRLREYVSKPAWRAADRVARASLRRDASSALVKLTDSAGDAVRFISDPPLLVPLRDLVPVDAADIAQWAGNLLTEYQSTLQRDRRLLVSRYRLVDIARKAVGVGSVGTRAWVLLLLDGDAQPLVLQAKEAVASVLEPYSPAPGPANQGQRVVEGQRLMQASSDMFLGWQRVVGVDGDSHDYYLRQFRDWKGSFDLEAIDAKSLEMLGILCAWTLARAHARSGDRVAISAYLGDGDEFERALVGFARAYARRNAHDHGELSSAVAAGTVAAELGR
ncbi:DUF2252 domain-containing protein [Intrasporangium flavum]|uniref:DUF2252 domain-containing protein n=1 Tax=Intrasporangium flavum TaxID=1428657 RepID=UPI001F625F84|nr:DUF2252 domain-containing protein [Intrasporangium flavum]